MLRRSANLTVSPSRVLVDFQALESGVSLIPRITATRFEGPAMDGFRNGPSAGLNIGQMIRRNGLHHDVAQRRGFSRATYDHAITGIGDHLAKQRIERSAADDS